MRLLRMSIALLCATLTLSGVANAESFIDRTYGNNLHLSMTEPLPQMAASAGICSLEPYMPSPELIRANYDVIDELHEPIEGAQPDCYIFTGNDFSIYTYESGRFIYQRDDYLKYSYMLYSCVDSDGDFMPAEIVSDYSALSFMTPKEAAESVELALGNVMPEVTGDFDVEYSVYPMHSSDMQDKIERELSGLDQSELDFFRRKHGIYEGCISDSDECYVVCALLSRDGIPMLHKDYSPARDVIVAGTRIYALVDADGIIFIDAAGLYSISAVQPMTEQQHSCDDVLQSMGAYLDKIVGFDPLEVNGVDVFYAPYPTGDGKYQLVQLVQLMRYPAPPNDYIEYMLVNASNGELYF